MGPRGKAGTGWPSRQHGAHHVSTPNRPGPVGREARTCAAGNGIEAPDFGTEVARSTRRTRMPSTRRDIGA
eukprot:987397-Lingulodinium_polyedra.AAC.1